MKTRISIAIKMVVVIMAASVLTVILLRLARPAPTVSGAPSAPAATVSGVIRHGGSPVSGVVVGVNWQGGSGSSTTEPSGAYSVSGVPMGGLVRIAVRPPIAQRLAFRNWSIDPLTGNLTKDFDLEDGQRLQGEFRQPNGSPYLQPFWLETNPSGFAPPPGEWYGVTAFNGQFDLVLPRGVYTLNTNPAPLPYYMPYTRIDLHTSDVTGLVVTLLDERPAPFPTTPPRASFITVGEPDLDGYATITGTADAVEPLSAVMLVNLSARNLMTATADASGAFTATLYVPPGSSVIVKYDREGDRVRQIWQDAFLTTKPDISYLSVLPGTILHVGPPPSSPTLLEFRTVGSFVDKGDQPSQWAGWAIDGALHLPPGTAVSRGQRVDYHAQIRITSPTWNCTTTSPPSINVKLRYLFDDNGNSDPWGIWFNAHLFTPTGLPIEHEAQGETIGVGSASFGGLTCPTTHTLWGQLESFFNVPNDLPDGVYLVEAYVNNGGVPLTSNLPLVPIWYHCCSEASMPPLTVGSPAAPHIPWTLLGDYPVNGRRGVQAREDVGHFSMPTRVVYPPHHVVIPRLDERTGKPLIYRLEPGSHWLSATDRRLPNPPHIPLKLPSGSLTVQVHKPDGSTDTIGPALLRQSSVRTPTTPGGTYLDFGTGHIGDLYHVTTMADEFAYSFDQYGPHTITLEGEVQDVYGNTYAIRGTYDVTVARILDLDPAQLPTTPYMQGDAFAPGLHVFPPVPADVTVKLTHMPYSDPAQAIVRTVTGQANRFGYFQPPVGTVITLPTPGEFRVDLTAVYTAPNGTLWMGTMTWGNVVEGTGATIEAHGRRGLDYKTNTIDDMPAWFEVLGLPTDKITGSVEVYYPYFSGDIHWGDETDGRRSDNYGNSIHSVITIKDKGGLDGPIYNLMRSKWPARNGFRWPPVRTDLTGLNMRLQVGEAPLFMTTQSGIDPGVDPQDIDLWGYSYNSSERPDVHVREILSEDNMGTAYWRFNDTYGYQMGEGAKGDLQGDLKWEFGGAVFRYLPPTNPITQYAIYSSLWVLLPQNDPVGARVTPPFRGAGALDGGPIMTLQGKDIDMLFLPKGVRPGDVLEVGDVIAFSGHVGPPLDSRISVTITAPSGMRHVRTWHANKIGWLYDPTFDFVANEAGRWTAEVFVLHDRAYAPTGFVPTQNNTGTVLGTSGQYEFYVVEPGSPKLFVTSPQPGFINWPAGHVEPIHIRGIAPAGTTAVRYTIHDKGVVMGQSSVTPDASGAFTVTYDAQALNAIFPFVSLTAHEGEWEGLADEVAINLLAVGSQARSNTVTLIGEEVFIGNEIHRIYLPLTLKGQ